MAKKSIKESDAKSIIALLIVLIAFAVFIFFYTNKEAVFASGSLQSLITLIVIAMGSLIVLLYLVNAPRSSKKRK